MAARVSSSARRWDAKGDAAYRAALTKGIAAGAKVLEQGGSAVDAVETVLNIFEDDPLFNAGRGAVFTSEGKNELDSSIMDGSNLKAGAVCRRDADAASDQPGAGGDGEVAVCDDGRRRARMHLRRSVGLEQVDPSFFFTESRWQGLVKQLKKEGKPVPPRPAGVPPPGRGVPVAFYDEGADPRSHGTTGVVALDRKATLRLALRRAGCRARCRGAWAIRRSSARARMRRISPARCQPRASGEYFIRLGVAREVCNLVYFKGMPLQQAADEVIHHELEALHGDGGVIAITPDGQTAFSFNTPGMFRARLSEGGKLEVRIYKDEQ